MQCKAITKKRKRCSIDANPGSDFCHVHDPQGTYQRQLRGEIPKGGRRVDQGSISKLPSDPQGDYQRQRRGEIPKGQAQGRRVGRPSVLDLPSDPQAILWADGLAEPNPGIGCYGWIARSGGRVTGSGHGLIGDHVTSNEAEYRALIEALSWTSDQDLTNVIVHMDSKLIVNQVRGSWKCKSENLWPLLSLAWGLAEYVRAFIGWIPRERNEEADALSRQAYYESKGVDRAFERLAR